MDGRHKRWLTAQPLSAMHAWSGSLPRYWPAVMDTSWVKGRRGCRRYAICLASCVLDQQTGWTWPLWSGRCHRGLSLWPALLKTYIKATNTRPFIPLFSCSSASSANLKSTFLFFSPLFVFVCLFWSWSPPFYFLILSRFHLHQKTLQLPITPPKHLSCRSA